MTNQPPCRADDGASILRKVDAVGEVLPGI
jgi:hypothetical protein